MHQPYVAYKNNTVYSTEEFTLQTGSSPHDAAEENFPVKDFHLMLSESNHKGSKLTGAGRPRLSPFIL